VSVKVGLVANPNAARDVRRLTSLARTVDVHERVNLVARVVRGLAAVGVDEVVAMSEPCRVAERAWAVLSGAGPSAGSVPSLRSTSPPAGDAAGTASAAAALAGHGVGCVITVGGDGTHRAVAAGWPDVVFASLPGGTNNAFGPAIDPTVLGLAAGLFAAGGDTYVSFARRVPRLDVELDNDRTGEDLAPALVDVAVVDEGWVGARAMWNERLLVEAVVTRADPTLCGLAGLAGMADGTRPAEAATHLRFGSPGVEVLAPLGPGQLVMASLATVSELSMGDEVSVGGGGRVTLAFDGERERVLQPGERAQVRVVADGPSLIDAAALVREAAATGEFAWPSAGMTGAGSGTVPNELRRGHAHE